MGYLIHIFFKEMLSSCLFRVEYKYIIKNADSNIKLSGFESWLPYFLYMWFGTIYLNSLYLRFLFFNCKVEILRVYVNTSWLKIK